MATRLEIRVDGDDVGAAKMLQAATSILRMLQGVERAKLGKASKTQWRVGMMSGHRFGLIEIWATGDGTERIEASLDVVRDILKAQKEKQ